MPNGLYPGRLDRGQERAADTCYRIDPPRLDPSLYVLGELLSEDQVLGADRRRRPQHKWDEPEDVREQTHHDSHKPNHALIMP